MSSQLRKAIMYWFSLILGIGILSVQFFKYVKGSLEFTAGEFIVTLIGVVLMINPHFISNSYKTIINYRFNGNKNNPDA